MKQSFSQRIGLSPIKVDIQTDYLDNPTKMNIWNYLYNDILEYIRKKTHKSDPFYEIDDNSIYSKFIESIWKDFLIFDVSELLKFNDTSKKYEFEKAFKQWYFDTEWYKIYDFIEYLIPVVNQIKKDNELEIDFVNNINSILNDNLTGYRIINNLVTPITNKIELSEIENIVNNNKFSEAAKHINTALGLLSNRQNPDYRNSIKESISAVENMCKLIMNKEDASLSGVIQKLTKKIDLNKKFGDGLKNLYDFTSGEDGIRHSLINSKRKITQADAKFMLVTCSAFVNYLIEKWDLIKEKD